MILTTSDRPRSLRELDLSEQRRLLAGVVAQPFVVALLAFFVSPFIMVEGGDAGYSLDATDAALSIAAGAGLLAGLISLVVVLPVATWMMKREQLTLARVLKCGLALGLLPYLLAVIASRGVSAATGLLGGLVLSSVLGLGGAVAFWLIVGKAATCVAAPDITAPRTSDALERPRHPGERER